MVRVLIVDDHRLVREGLRRTLEEAGHDVVGEARDGAEGLDMAAELRPHVVLMDVSMPILDGITATRRMRTRAPAARVVILTMHAEQELVEEARTAGAVGYLLKDASGDEVADAVGAAAAGKQVISAGLGEASRSASLATAGAAGTEDGAGKGLTGRERQILQLLADGNSPVEVAEALVISPKTVRNHLTHVYDKLGVSSRSQAIVTALKNGLIELG